MKAATVLLAMAFTLYSMANADISANVASQKDSHQKAFSPVVSLERRIDVAERKLEDCYEVMKARVDEKVSAGISNAEAEYKERYEELKGEQDRFLNRLGIGLIVVSILVAFFGALAPYLFKMDLNKKYDDALDYVSNKNDSIMEEQKKQFSKIKEHFEQEQDELAKNIIQLKADQFYQLAKIEYAQFKNVPTLESLMHITLNLSCCLKYNVAINDADCLKTCISLAEKVLLKKSGEEVEQLRNQVFSNLQSWNWGITEKDVRRVLENGHVDVESVSKTITTINEIFNRSKNAKKQS